MTAGRSDLFGRKLEVTKRAVADNIASAAELVMGEADECTPAAIIRGIGLPMGDHLGVETIDADRMPLHGRICEEPDAVVVRFCPKTFFCQKCLLLSIRILSAILHSIHYT